MLYKNAWQELKEYLEWDRWSAQDKVFYQNVLAKMRSLEDKWKISPPKSRAGRVKRRVEV